MGVKMKGLKIYILILFVAFFLPGCNEKEQKPGKAPGQAGTTETADKGNSKEITGYELVTGDNLTVAAEFAKDLSEENFTKLLQAYQYDEKMKETMASEDTKKTVYFHNAEYGSFKGMKEAYILSRGAYQYVMVPVESSVNNFNYQIAFDGNHNIVGFTYGEYALKEPVQNTIPDGVTESEYIFTSDGFVIPGTFTKPEEGSHFPTVILVQGFGPSDRDESIYENKPFRDIAWELARQGIASYRYDKRSYLYAAQMAEDVTSTIDDEITKDVIAAADMVKNIEGVDPAGIYILGHSLGGYAIPRIAGSLSGAAGYIMMAAPAQHIKDYIIGRFEYLADEDEKVTEEEQKQIDDIKNQVKLLNTPEKIPEKKLIMGAYRDYWIDLADYNPVKTAEEITVPVLVIQGERDYQVTMKQFTMWKNSFQDSDNWTFKSYASLNHFMMQKTGSPDSEEYRIRSQVADEVTQDIVEFIMNR